MANPSSQTNQDPPAGEAAVTPIYTQLIPPQSAEGQPATPSDPIHNTEQPQTSGITGGRSAAQLYTPLVGSLNTKAPLFYIKASAAQLKAIIQSAPDDVRSRVRANASKEAMLDEFFKLRQCEAVNATRQALEHIEPHEALRKLLTMEARDITAAVDSNPAQVRELIGAALKADNTLTPREVPEDRHSIIYTVLTRQVNGHKLAKPSPIASPDHLPHQPTLIPDQQPPHLVRDANQAVEKTTTPGVPNLQTASLAV